MSLFLDTLMESMLVPPANVHTVLNAQATREGVLQGFDRLKKASTDDSGIIVYFNGHGVILPVGREGRLHEEVFCLWSEEYPFAGIYAVMSGIWMRAGEFAELLNRVPARAKVMIADTCHAGEIWDELPQQTKIEYGLEGAALLAAARAGGYALSGPEHTIFTHSLCRAMQEGAKNLRQAFEIAQRETIILSRPLCKSYSQARSKHLCTEQVPTIEDPGQVIPLFQLH
ncbi:MAG: caspase family protein [Desulfohalobiaceae bacterium]